MLGASYEIHDYCHRQREEEKKFLFSFNKQSLALTKFRVWFLTKSERELIDILIESLFSEAISYLDSRRVFG